MNDIKLSISERFISEFHNSNTGVTSKVFADLPVIKGTQLMTSSYQCLTSIVENQPGKLTVLDLACGDGFLLSILAGRNQHGLSLQGIDLSQGEVDAARLRLGDSATILLAKAQDMQFADNSIDIVLCHMALMLMEDVEIVLSELHRVLKKNSVFSTIIGAKSPLPQKAGEIFSSLLAQYKRKEEYALVRFGDPRIRTDDGISDIFSKYFKQLKIEYLPNQQFLSPQELWNWFYKMYDLNMFNSEDVIEIESRFISSIQQFCDSKGEIEYMSNLKQITAISV